MNIDSAPLKADIDTSDQRSSIANSSNNNNNYNKTFRDYLEELRQACDNDIFIKRTSNIKYKSKKWANIQAYIIWFNRLSSFVTTEIVKNLNKKKRVDVINYFINVAFDCFEIGNFNSAMAIIG
jgi:hypothetical protein